MRPEPAIHLGWGGRAGFRFPAVAACSTFLGRNSRVADVATVQFRAPTSSQVRPWADPKAFFCYHEALRPALHMAKTDWAERQE